ncbi:MAG: hypothetical protein AB7S78_03410 [Candidatus Omnitrophota bacterium]
MQIYYLFTRKNRNPINHYLALWGRVHFWNILPVPYQSLVRKKTFPKGLYIFSDLELLKGLPFRDSVLDIYRKLGGLPDQYKILNNPNTTLSRYPLLRKLHDQGLNSFNVYRMDEDLSRARFPVFLRRADDHRGPQTGLLRSPQDLRAAVARLQSERENMDEWLVTEYCDVADSDGIFRKYSSFIMDGVIIPRHILFGNDWVLKYSKKDLTPSFHSEEINFLENNPYQDQLLTIFKTAGIQYGRIDFGILEGRVQTWEINTNPMIISMSNLTDPNRLDIHQIFFKKFSDTLKKFIASPNPPASVSAYWPERIISFFHMVWQRFIFTKPGGYVLRIIWRLERLKKNK